MRRPVYTRDRFGNVWKYFDSELFPDQRRKIMLAPVVLGRMIAEGFVFKFKRDDFREKSSRCSPQCGCGGGLTADDAVAKETNQPPEEF